MLVRRYIFIMLVNLLFKICNCLIPVQLSAKICHKNDPKLNECFTQFLTDILKGYPQGIPEMNLDSIDPFIVDEFNINENILGGQLKMIVTNITVIGLTTANIDDVSIDLNNLIVNLKLSIPFLQVNAATLQANWKILLFTTTKTDATLYANITNTFIEIKLPLEYIEKNGTTYFGLNSLRIQTKLTDVQIRLVSHNSKNQRNDNIVVQIFNKLKRIILNNMNPVLEHVIETISKEKLGLVLSTVPADELLPN